MTLDDTAPQVAAAAITRIRSYAGNPPDFATVLELEGFFRQVYQPYGTLTNAQWRRLTPHYDPAMVQQFISHPDDYLI